MTERKLVKTSSRIRAEAMPDYLSGGFTHIASHRLIGDVQMQTYSHRSTVHSVMIPAVAEPLLVLVLTGGALVQERVAGGQWIASEVKPGDFFLTMSPEPYEMRWDTGSNEDFSVVHIYLSQRMLDLAAQDLLGSHAKAVRLIDVSGAKDPQVLQLVTLLRTEMTRAQEPSTLYVQSIAQTLAVHLVRYYRDEQDTGRPGNALPSYKLHRVIDRMRAELANGFSLSLFAAQAGMSNFHFSRMFSRATGQSPSQYFIQLRIAQARELLTTTTMSVIEVALEVGYSSPSHFAQVFKQLTGVSPSGYR